jgi:hypothetical protein
MGGPVQQRLAQGYRPYDHYQSDEELRAAIDAIAEHYFGRFTHAAARGKSIFDNAGIAVAVVERRVRGWRGARRARLAEAGGR